MTSDRMRRSHVPACLSYHTSVPLSSVVGELNGRLRLGQRGACAQNFASGSSVCIEVKAGGQLLTPFASGLGIIA